MTNNHLFQFRIPNLTMVSRAAELFEAEADNAADNGNGQLEANWRELSVVCLQHVRDRRYQPRTSNRPGHNELREDVLEVVMRGRAPYPELSRAEAREASRRMTAEGHSASSIAGRVGVCARSVVRWRQWDRQETEENTDQ